MQTRGVPAAPGLPRTPAPAGTETNAKPMAYLRVQPTPAHTIPAPGERGPHTAVQFRRRNQARWHGHDASGPVGVWHCRHCEIRPVRRVICAGDRDKTKTGEASNEGSR